MIKYVNSIRGFLFVPLLVLGVLVFGGEVSAAELVDQAQLVDTGIFSPVYNVGIDFIPTASNITAFEFAVTNNLNNLNVGLTICRGVATSGLPSTGCGSNTFVASTSQVFSGNGVKKISCPAAVGLIAGVPHYAIVVGQSGAGFSIKQNSASSSDLDTITWIS